MRLVRVDKNREAEVPTSWSEGERMIGNALGAFYDGRGKNLARLSIARAASLMDYLVSNLWPVIRRSRSFTSCNAFAFAKARASIKERSRENVG
jgi:hypothetical protein